MRKNSRYLIISGIDEKPLIAGDIIVARATDPAWTPLFVNASTIILEIGAPLHHGFLVVSESANDLSSSCIHPFNILRDGGGPALPRLPAEEKQLAKARANG